MPEWYEDILDELAAGRCIAFAPDGSEVSIEWPLDWNLSSTVDRISSVIGMLDALHRV